MKFELDWAYLRFTLIAAIAASVAGLLMFSASYFYLGYVEDEYAAASARRDALSEQYRDAKEDRRLVEDYLARYEALVREGLVGDERRLDWVSALETSVTDLRLPSLRYQIMPQEPVSQLNAESGGEFVLMASRAKLSIGLLHELDLLRLITELEKKVPGLFNVDSCTLQRNVEYFGYIQDQANLNAECELRWFTIKNQVGGPGA